MNTFIETFTGRRFHPLNPQADEVAIEDIAHALSNTCRYSGHSLHFYSVAEHSVLYSNEAEIRGYGPEEALFGLLHDAGEAYLADVAAPIKRFFPTFQMFEDEIMEAVQQAFGLPYSVQPPHLKQIDVDLLITEAVTLLPSEGDCFDEKYQKHGNVLLGLELPLLSPLEAERLFLYRFHELRSYIG